MAEEQEIGGDELQQDEILTSVRFTQHRNLGDRAKTSFSGMVSRPIV
jgi:hypothetical protein